MQLENKAAIVTGAGTGVGRATALKLARLGAHVVVNYNRSRDAAEEVVREIEDAGGRAIAHQADISSDEQARTLVEAAREAFGRLDILVNNAGTTEFIPFDQLDRVSDDVWQKIMGVNVVGPFHCARAAAPVMRETTGGDGGQIVNVSSVAALAGAGSSIPYAASKAALNNLTLALARTLAPEIRVNAVAPGFIAGSWLEEGLGDRYETVKALHEANLPLRKVCAPEDVADAIVSFATGSTLVTGQILVCDGGARIMQPVRI